MTTRATNSAGKSLHRKATGLRRRKSKSDTPDTTESANKGQPWDRVIAKAEPKFTEIAALDGNLVTFKREAMFAHQIITAGEYLQKCTPDSIFNAIVNVASVGLSLSPAE